MAKRIGIGVVFTVLLYFLGSVLIGGIVGGIAGGKHPENAAQAGAQAAAAFFAAYRLYVVLGSVALGVVLTATGVLPGTGAPKKAKKKAGTPGRTLPPERRGSPPAVDL